MIIAFVRSEEFHALVAILNMRITKMLYGISERKIKDRVKKEYNQPFFVIKHELLKQLRIKRKFHFQILNYNQSVGQVLFLCFEKL